MFVRCPATTPPEGEVARPADPGRGDQLILGEAEHPSCDERAHKLGQAGVVPTDLADSGIGGEAETHLELVGDDDSDENVLSTRVPVLTRGECGRDDVRGMGGVLLPVDIVVVHRADQKGIHQAAFAMFVFVPCPMIVACSFPPSSFTYW